ncbi:MAG: alginate lyase [Fibrobacter sp.]|nr:alginate lyase [Fibrobacter sp.]
MFWIILFSQLLLSNLPVPTDALQKVDARIERSSQAVWDKDSSGTFLRLKYPEGCVGTSKKTGCAIQFSLPLNDLQADELWGAYEVFFEEGFDFGKGGKLPGFCGGKCYTGGDKPKEADGWSNRIMWKKNGFLTQYVYHVKQSRKYADNFVWNLNGTLERKRIEIGKWHRIVMHVKLNNVKGENVLDNGHLQTWFDGELVVDVDTLRLRNSTDQKIDQFYFSTFHGGGDPSYAPRWDSFIRFRNLQIVREEADLLR